MGIPVGRMVALCGLFYLGLQPTVSSADMAVSQEAKGLAFILNTTKSESQVQQAVRYIMKRLGVRELPDAYIGTDIGISGIEIAMTAKAFIEGKQFKLDDITSMYGGMGVRFQGSTGEITGLGAGAPKAFTIEKVLRELRTKAEKGKEDPNAFAILLMDALGDRKENPSKLLEVHKPGCADDQDKAKFLFPGGPTVQGLFDESVEAMLEDNPDDPPTPGELAMAKSFMTAMIAANKAASQDGRTLKPQEYLGSGMDSLAPIMGPALEKANLTQDQFLQLMQKGSSETAKGLRSSEQIPETREYTESQARLLEDQSKGTDPMTLAKDSLRAIKAYRDMYAKLRERNLKDSIAKMVNAKSESKESGAEDTLESVGGTLIAGWAGDGTLEDMYWDADTRYATIKENVDALEEEDRQAKRLKMSIPRPNPDRSCLYLDPIQVMILQVGLFSLNIPIPEAIGGVKP